MNADTNFNPLTSVCVGAELANDLPPQTNFKEYFGPDFVLHPPLSSQGRYENKNTKRTLDVVKQKVFDQLRYITGAPSVQMQEIPPDLGAVNGRCYLVFSGGASELGWANTVCLWE